MLRCIMKYMGKSRKTLCLVRFHRLIIRRSRRSAKKNNIEIQEGERRAMNPG